MTLCCRDKCFLRSQILLQRKPQWWQMHAPVLFISALLFWLLCVLSVRLLRVYGRAKCSEQWGHFTWVGNSTGSVWFLQADTSGSWVGESTGSVWVFSADTPGSWVCEATGSFCLLSADTPRSFFSVLSMVGTTYSIIILFSASQEATTLLRYLEYLVGICRQFPLSSFLWEVLKFKDKCNHVSIPLIK